MLIVLSLVATLLINFFLFLVAYKKQSDKLTDFAYSISFIAVIVPALALSSEKSYLLWLAGAMVLAWAIRLGSFLVIRIRKVGKDHRFDGIRENFWSFLKFWLAQGVVAWLLLLPVLFIASEKQAFSNLVCVGFAVWAFGLLIETFADIQKYKFKQDPKNKDKWIDSGLWQYSRHPNYFGEITIWVGMYLLVFSGMSTIERIVGLISPIAIYITLMYVSGVPILEKYANEKWGDNPRYKKYKNSTSLLVLSPKRK